ncbi:hypothetical protein V3851_14900 [Paenibacillus sp. M1]|uniref:Uncharacterized protein n=1 Tax=Paenibacillus haidiansis TaxID=1574488 RepID=A0ABU7VW52_9BACL
MNPNLSVHSAVPFYDQYPKPLAVNSAKRQDNKDTPLSFQEILREKIKARQERQAPVTGKF